MEKGERQALPVVLAAAFGPKGILLLRREFAPFAGMWGMPGGKVRHGEHLAEAVEREVLEETGVRVGFRELCGVVTESVFAGRRLDAHYVLFVCRVSARAGKATASREGEVRWFAPKELAGMGSRIVPSDRVMLEKLVLRRAGPRLYRCVVRSGRSGYRIDEFRSSGGS